MNEKGHVSNMIGVLNVNISVILLLADAALDIAASLKIEVASAKAFMVQSFSLFGGLQSVVNLRKSR